MWSCFAKRFTTTALAPPMELFMEMKPPKNGFTSEVEPCQTRPYFFEQNTEMSLGWSVRLRPRLVGLLHFRGPPRHFKIFVTVE
jgi:hypothetical protein